MFWFLSSLSDGPEKIKGSENSIDADIELGGAPLPIQVPLMLGVSI